MINLVWQVERPKYRRLEVQVNQRDGFVFLLRDIKSIHPAIPSEKVLIKIRKKKEAEPFIRNICDVLSLEEGLSAMRGIFHNAKLNGKKTKINYVLVGETPSGKETKRKKVELKLILDQKERNRPGSASMFEFKSDELEQIMWRLIDYFK